MIPKLIHFVWLGRQPKPPVVRRCVASWRRHLSDYRIIEWNETNFDLGCNRYLREACNARKWAFASDYIRMRVVHDQGGIYLDSDCFVLDTLDPFLKHAFFSGFEGTGFPFTATFGAVPGHPLVARTLLDYEHRAFAKPDGTLDITTNTQLVGGILRNEYGCELNGMYQGLRDGVAIYPADRLCTWSDQSVVVHLMSGSWEGPVRHRLLLRLLGGRASANLFRIQHKHLYNFLDSLARIRSRFYRGGDGGRPADSCRTV